MNSFAALDSDNEDEVVVVVQKPKKEAKVAPVVAAVVAPVKAAAASSSKPVKAAGGNGPPKAPKEGGNSAPKADRPPRAPAGADGEVSKEDNRGGGRGPAGRGGKEYRSRGGRGADGAPRENPEGNENRPKRQYERRDTTGRGRGEQSKGGRGAHSFGNPEQEALEAEKDPASAAPDSEIVGGWGEGAPEEVAAEPVVEAEPEPVAMTMEEFLAKRAETRANAEMFGEKKGTRQTETDLSGLQRKEAEVYGTYGNFEKVKAEEAARKNQRSLQKNLHLDVAFRNASLEAQGRDEGESRGGRGEGRGGRGGRGEGRGRGGGRGGDSGRGPKPQSAPRSAGSNFDTSDAMSFPSL